jgi:hypothetical protein
MKTGMNLSAASTVTFHYYVRDAPKMNTTMSAWSNRKRQSVFATNIGEKGKQARVLQTNCENMTNPNEVIRGYSRTMQQAPAPFHFELLRSAH